MKWFIYSIFVVLYLLVTFYGVGPILLADGSDQERMITIVYVLIVYVVLTIVLRIIVKKMKNH